jgi:hypothetical protein
MSNKSSKYQYILITGEMRSGTTFLANLLNTQANMMVYSDILLSLFMVGKARGITDLHAPLSETDKNLLISNLNPEGFAMDLTFDDLRNAESWMDLFKRSMDRLTEAEGGQADLTHVGIKKTNEQVYLNGILDGGIKVIYVVRDPRDVMLSNKNRHVDHDIYSFADRLKENLKVARDLESHPNLMVLRYHELILEKETAQKALEAFLNTKLDFGVEELTMRKDIKYRDNSSFGDVKKLFDPKAVGRWENKKDEEEVIFSNSFFKEELQWMNLKIDESMDRVKTARLMKGYQKRARKNKLKAFAKKLIR